MPASDSPLKLVAYGDSITQSYKRDEAQRWTTHLGLQLREKLGDRAPAIINAGVGGNTSAEGLRRIEQDVLAHDPWLVLVEFGGNDCIKNPDRHVPLASFVGNLRTIHQRVTQQGGRVAFMSFPPVVNDWHFLGHDPFYDEVGGLDEFIQAYRDATQQLAVELACPFFDLDQLLRQAGARDGQEVYAQPDGIHLTLEAEKLLVEKLLPVVESWLPGGQEG